MDILKLINAVETLDDKFYHGDVHADTVQALKDYAALKELIDTDVTDAVKDIETELKIIKRLLNHE